MEGVRSSSAKPERRAGIIFFQNGECDCCDSKTTVAILDFGLINTFHWNICKKCLLEFAYQFCSEKEIRKFKLKQLNEKS